MEMIFASKGGAKSCMSELLSKDMLSDMNIINRMAVVCSFGIPSHFLVIWMDSALSGSFLKSLAVFLVQGDNFVGSWPFKVVTAVFEVHRSFRELGKFSSWYRNQTTKHAL